MKNSVNKALLDGKECDVYYQFNDNDVLETGLYFFTKEYSNPQLYLEDFSRFKKMLCNKYGQPSSEKETWHKYTKARTSHYAQAIEQGLLSMDAMWTTDRSDIRILLVKGNCGHPVLQIHYSARQIA